MMDTPQFYVPLAIGFGLFWTITYILIIKRGFQDKSYGMPMWPLAINISWEFIYSFVTPAAYPQVYINIVWFLFDCVILYQFFRYWKNHFEGMSGTTFYPWSILVLMTSFLAVLFIQFDVVTVRGVNERFPLGLGAAYSAFGSNVIMSILFIHMIWARNSVKGQSIYIALAKWLGTATASFRSFIYPELLSTPGGNELLFPFFYVSIFIFDLIYICMVYKKCKEQNINPWKRF